MDRIETNTTNSTGLSEEDQALLDAAIMEACEGTNTEDNTEDNEQPEVLPVNSASLLVNETSSRFSSAIWYEAIQRQIVTIAGLGGIGSYLALLIGRLKVGTITLWDDDKVDATNLSGQLYSKNDINTYKVYCASKMIRDYADYYRQYARNEKFTVASTSTPIMICGFDNMEARRDFYGAWKRYTNSRLPENKPKCLFIDGRLAAEEFQVFCIKGDDDFLKKKYEEEWLFSDEEAESTVCSYKQTSFCANMIASVMVNLFVNFVANQCNPLGPLIDRELPFYTHYDAERMYLKTELS